MEEMRGPLPKWDRDIGSEGPYHLANAYRSMMKALCENWVKHMIAHETWQIHCS